VAFMAGVFCVGTKIVFIISSARRK